MADFTALKTAIQTYIKQNGNEEITGNILQEVLLSMVQMMGDGAINELVNGLASEVTNRQNADGILQDNINTLGGRIDDVVSFINAVITKLVEGYLYAGIATTSTNPGTPSGKVFYIATAAGTYANFENLTVAHGVTILKYNGSAWSQDLVYEVDGVPTAGSGNLVESGGVAQIASFTINRISTSGTGYYLLNDGSIAGIGTSSNYVDEFEITSGYIYYASGRIPPQEGACFVAYYDESKLFIGYEIDGTGSSRKVTNYQLTIPNNAKYAKIVGRAIDGERPILQCISSGELARQLKEMRDSVNVSGNLSPNKTEKQVYLLQDGSYKDLPKSLWKIDTYKAYSYKDLIASGRTGENLSGCSICYYDEDGIFLGYEKPWNGTAGNFSNYNLTIPNGTYWIKIAGHTTSLKCTTNVGDNFQITQSIVDDIRTINGVLDETVSDNMLEGKNIAIIGASMDTHGNSGDDCNAVEITIEPEDVGQTLSAYITYNDVQEGLTIAGRTFTSEDVGNEVTFVPTLEDVGKVVGLPRNYNSNSLDVWWMYVKRKFNCNIIPVAWSGSGYTRNRENQSDGMFKTAYAWHEAQIRKCGIRTPGTMIRTAPDVIFLCRATNDWTHSPYARITEGYFDTVDWQYPVSDKDPDDNFGYLEGICLTVKKLREAYPFTPIVIFTQIPCKRVNHDHFPANNGFANQPQYNKAMRDAADFLGCQLVDRAKCAITWENMYPTYISDSATTPTHPNAKGHEVIGKFVISQLVNMNFNV